MNNELLCDILAGNYEELEYEIENYEHRQHGSIVQLSLYENDDYVSSYLYGDSDEAIKDMREITNEFGVRFKELQHEPR